MILKLSDSITLPPGFLMTTIGVLSYYQWSPGPSTAIFLAVGVPGPCMAATDSSPDHLQHRKWSPIATDGPTCNCHSGDP